ncbi:aminotransferase class I/II-fold pyridoxal phosphate-dependent enzyme [Geomicrobium halophilum]|nr:aminotransferase class I/II-fold pyridoxal phosphate-dependent enzyme [Geomicrobium halophilum]
MIGYCPLIEKLEAHNEQNPVSMHVPGHKNGRLLSPPYSTYFEQVMQLDQTELKGLDDLHAPMGAILEAEHLAAEQYGCGRTFFLVGGSTLGNLTMILAFFERGDRVLVQRDVHHSVIHGLELAGVEAVFISPDYDKYSGLTIGVSKASVAYGFESYPDIQGVLLSSPSYYGNVGDLKGAIDEAKSHEAYVFVDEAHGAHLHIDAEFPISALAAGADAVVQSAHKTLPALTMGAFLHLRSTEHEARCRYWLHRLQTSSPSYPILASLDVARAFSASMCGKKIASQLDAFQKSVDEACPAARVKNDDPLKLILRAPAGWNGWEWEDRLNKEQIYVELSDRRHVLLVLPLESPDLWKHTILPVLTSLYEGEHMETTFDEMVFPPFPSVERYSFSKKLENQDVETVSVKNAEGRRIAEEIIPYPPGIPLWMEGEMIDQPRLQFLCNWLASGGRIQAASRIYEGRLLVRKEVGENE